MDRRRSVRGCGEQSFVLELGRGFCFVARQKRIAVAGDYFYIDLVFYNRLLRCFVLVDLELGKLTHQDLGQMQMYVNYFDRFQLEAHEEPSVGIVLCSDKNDTMVRIPPDPVEVGDWLETVGTVVNALHRDGRHHDSV
jgi:hypothetical protein